MGAPTYTYNNCDGSQPLIDFVRLLIPDTGGLANLPNNGFVFSDQEVLGFGQINQVQCFQAGFFYSGSAGATTPLLPSNYYRAAALALNTLAGNSARLMALAQILDVKLQNVKEVSDALRATAQRLLDMDDNSGAFVFAEQCTTVWAYIDRFWNQAQRQSGGLIV